ncbi:RNA polymerase sigma-70 factor, ECF subfamily [Nocardioides exalbidus]|uniref:RNA polymerase sigma-70 factor, ECF subfamily n=1 Tax=Nocardioides exalbidus TaxID=402596 RepID=A0A1H4K0X5_9ACTN|nr:sigma-70 family RNA polymerase sigma factor [Nocardioides exalbidus]SEB51765.1 RNA polymerase sigma-70 factor, ECF subfamily [Nocardioides exalbidus]
MRRTSSNLVSAARAGEEWGWRGLYRLHSARITALVRVLPRSDWASSPEDVVAEAWLTAASKMHEFSGSDEDFGGWLFTIARNHSTNQHRTGVRRRTDPVEPLLLGDRGGEAANAPAAMVEHDEAVAELLGHLSPREAEVVACIDVAGLDVAATARALGMKPTAVRVARHRALGRLRTVLDGEGEAAGSAAGPVATNVSS